METERGQVREPATSWPELDDDYREPLPETRQEELDRWKAEEEADEKERLLWEEEI